MSAIRCECLAAKQWPAVIAEIIAAYAGYTLEESVGRLVGTSGIVGKDIILRHDVEAWWSAYDGCISFKFGITKSRVFGVPPDRLAESIRQRWWISVAATGHCRAMLAEETDALIEWLATA